MTSSWSTKRHLDVELGELRLPVGPEVLVAVAAGDLVVALQPATISSCLNSCGDCGSAYQVPGCSRTGTRKSRAPSGVDRVSVGVSTSRKPWLVHHLVGQVGGPGADPQGAGRAARGGCRGSGT